MNFAAASGFLPLALATKAQPPPTVTYLPSAGVGQLEDAVWNVLGVVVHRRDRPDADVLHGAVAGPEVGDDVPSALPEPLARRGARVDRVLPEFQRLHHAGRIEGALAVGASGTRRRPAT